MLCSAQSPRVTGRMLSTPPAIEVSSPVTALTCRSATRTNSSSRMRSSGSTLPSGWPSVASHIAVWRATSQLTGPWRLNIRARSPNIGRPSNGFPPSGPELVTGSS